MDPGFELEQEPLAVQPAAEADQFAVGPDDPVTRHDDRQRVVVAGGARRPGRRRARPPPGRSRRSSSSRRRGSSAITAQTARSNGLPCDEHERHRELGPLAGEVLRELAPNVDQRPVRRPPASPSLGPSRSATKGHAAHRASRRRDAEVADRRWHPYPTHPDSRALDRSDNLAARGAAAPTVNRVRSRPHGVAGGCSTVAR